MIISASYKTDIPAFFGQWFLNRLRAGWCRMVNPYGRQVYAVDLRREAVDGFVFWTKNVGPFMATLAEVHRRGYPFVVQHGITGYPRELERSVPRPERAVEHLRRIAGEFGPRVVVWRYDTILDTSLTPGEFHLGNFERLARHLEGIADEVVISFAQMYRKTVRNLAAEGSRLSFDWHDPGWEEKRALTRRLVDIAGEFGIRLTVCSQREGLVAGAGEARCIDAGRLESIAGVPIRARLKGNREECGCYASRDIGEYETCPAGCVYCYAVSGRAGAVRRLRSHDPEGEFLFPPAKG